MHIFDALLTIFERLMGPDGCPWDKSQTFISLQPYLIEETFELAEAIDEDDLRAIIEELGDVLNIIIFYCKVAEQEGKFTLKEVVDTLCEKLLRRHPHVFQNVEAQTIDQVIDVWSRAKAEEKAMRKSILEGIPKSLDSLMRMQKILGRMTRHHYLKPSEDKITENMLSEEFISLIQKAEASGLDAYSVMRTSMNKIEKEFAEWEKASK